MASNQTRFKVAEAPSADSQLVAAGSLWRPTCLLLSVALAPATNLHIDTCPTNRQELTRSAGSTPQAVSYNTHDPMSPLSVAPTC